MYVFGLVWFHLVWFKFSIVVYYIEIMSLNIKIYVDDFSTRSGNLIQMIRVT